MRRTMRSTVGSLRRCLREAHLMRQTGHSLLPQRSDDSMHASQKRCRQPSTATADCSTPRQMGHLKVAASDESGTCTEGNGCEDRGGGHDSASSRRGRGSSARMDMVDLILMYLEFEVFFFFFLEKKK